MLDTQLGPYRIEAELGLGGMGKVYRAEGPQGPVAVKVLHPHLLATPGFFKRFLREAEIGRQVDHPNVVRTLDVDALSIDGKQHHFLVMEFVEGQTLRGLVRELSIVPEQLCRHIGREIAQALAAIHAAGAVHRDLKPENVLITDRHVVKVMDLGVAQLADEAMRLSQTGVFVGSVLYAAPEQFGTEGLDRRADWYSLGLMLYELGTGTHPSRAVDFASIMSRRLNESPRPAGELNPQLSAYFEEVVRCLLERDRDRRLDRFPDEESAWWRERSLAIRTETRRPLRRIRIPRETALFGRADDVAWLSERFARTKDGDGQVVLLEGEAGIGKTRLADEFVGGLGQAGEDFNFLFGSYPPGGAATAAGAFSEAYCEHFGKADLENALSHCLGGGGLLVPAFAALLRGDAPPPDAERLTRESMQGMFGRVTQALAGERPTIVLIDDLHFAPAEGRALFAALSQAARGHRVLVMGTARPGLPGDWLTNIERQEHAARRALSRLGPKDLVLLLADSFRSEDLAERLGAQIAIKSDGNPFFAFEIVRGLREGQFITRSGDGSWVTTDAIRNISIPSSVKDLIHARLSSLAPEEHELLDVASCCGFEFDARLLARALGAERIPTLRSCARIEHQHRLIRSVGRDFAFDHHQVQEAIYAALPLPLREEYHAVIGEALEEDGDEPVVLAQHFLKGGRGKEALRYLGDAMEHLKQAYLHEPAIELADLALGVEGLVEGAARARLLMRKIERLGSVGRLDELEAAAEEMLAHAREAGDARLETDALAERARARYATGRFEEAAVAYEANLARARELGDRKGEAVATFMLGNVHFMRQRYDDARALYEEAAAFYGEAGDRVSEARAAGNLGMVLQALGRTDEALEAMEEVGRIFAELGQRGDEGMNAMHIGDVLLEFDRLAEARAHYERGLALLREVGERRFEANAVWSLATVAERLGDLEEARRRAVSSLAIFNEIGDRWMAFNAHATLGRVAETMGEPAEAEARFTESRNLAVEVGNEDGVAGAWIGLGRVQTEDKARESLEQALALAREHDLRAREVIAACRLALLPGDDEPPAPEALADLPNAARMEASFLLWRATREPRLLADAKELLQWRLDHAPPECRTAMLANVPLHKAITEA